MSPFVTLEDGRKIFIGDKSSGGGNSKGGQFAPGGGRVPGAGLQRSSPREFTKEAHFNQAAKEMKEPWVAKLSSKEIDAVQHYNGTGYQKINSDLRAGKEPSGTAKLIDSALSKSPLSESMVAYRGFSGRELMADFKNSVGKTFSDKGFVSTSLDKNIATGFMRGQGKVLATIHIPAGTHAGYVGAGERELLIGRGQGFRITEARIKRGQYYVTMELVSHHH
jgi:hypothetical protein